MFKPIMALIFSIGFVLVVPAQVSWDRYAWGTPRREGFAVLLPLVPTQVSGENGEQGVECETTRGSDFVPLKSPITFNVTFLDGVGKEEYDRQVEQWMNLVGAPGYGGEGAGGGMTERERAESEREKNLNRNTRPVSVCGFPGVEFGNSNSVQQFFLVNGRLYHVWVTGAGRSNPEAARFLRSFTLVRPWEAWTGMRTNKPFAGRGAAPARGPAFESVVCKNIGKAGGARGAAAYPPRNSALRFIFKPPAVYPEEEKKNMIRGSVRLRVEFLKDGSVGEVAVLKGINKAFDESALRAARRIKFEPQRRAGKFITVTKTVEYGFEIY